MINAYATIQAVNIVKHNGNMRLITSIFNDGVVLLFYSKDRFSFVTII